ncbi:MAG TPA: transcriptional regulator [Spirosoma sp.]|nr:transcriptional regulator [Spirosoma sp.]
MICQIVSRLTVLVGTLLLAQTAPAQVDTLFHLSPDRRILRLWQSAPFFAIDHPPYLKAYDSTRVFTQLDRLAAFARQQDDDRLFWSVQLHKILFRHILSTAGGKPSTLLEAAQTYLDQCPVPVVRASYWYHRGRYYFEQQRFDEGFRWLLRAQQAFEQIGYDRIPEASQYLYGLGDSYYFFGEYARCIRSMVASFRYPPWVHRARITAHNTVGLCYQQLRDYANAQVYFARTLTLAQQYGDSAYIAIAYTKLGHQLLLTGKPRQALPYLYSGYRLSWTQAPEYRVPENAALSDLYTAQALIQLDSVRKARLCIDRSTRMFTNRSWSSYELDYFQAQIDYYKKAGNYRLATVYLDSSRQLDKSLQAKFNTRLLLANQSRVNAERYTYETRRLEAERKNAVQVRNIILAAALLLALAGLYAFRQNQQKRIQEEKLLLQQKQRAEELLTEYVARIQEKNELIESISVQLKQAEASSSPRPPVDSLLNQVILTEADWQQFKDLFEGVYPGFFSTLRTHYPDLTGAEIRLLALTKLRIDTRQMSRMLGISTESIHKTKYRMHKKLGANEKSSLINLLGEGEQ